MKAAAERAHERIAPMIRRTPCRRSTELSREVGADVYLKLENQQRSGSFKLRGVANKILSLSSDESGRLLVAASSGNHGAALSHAVQELGLEGKLFLPRTASRAKLRAIACYGIAYELVGDDIVETEIHARSHARDNLSLFVPPYNDPAVIAGQATIAIELFDQLDGFDAVVAPVGGGGLISGVGAYVKAVMPVVEVIGCQPMNSPVMFDSIQAGRIVDRESSPTLSDGTAGGIEPASITFDLCRQHVDDFVLLTEKEIAEAIRFISEHEGMVIEGAAALSVAAALKRRESFAGRRIVLIVSGSKIDDEVLRRILA
jgi:threonine dehydratase